MSTLLQPHLMPIADGWYQLVEEYRYQWFLDGIDNELIIPKGTITDGISAPRIVWTLADITPGDGLMQAAGLLHDVHYRFQGQVAESCIHRIRTLRGWRFQRMPWSRIEIDALFARVMREAGVAKHKRRRAYFGVRLFGWRAWQQATFDLYRPHGYLI